MQIYLIQKPQNSLSTGQPRVGKPDNFEYIQSVPPPHFLLGRGEFRAGLLLSEHQVVAMVRKVHPVSDTSA